MAPTRNCLFAILNSIQPAWFRPKNPCKNQGGCHKDGSGPTSRQWTFILRIVDRENGLFNLGCQTPIMENQMEKKMENEMETGII